MDWNISLQVQTRSIPGTAARSAFGKNHQAVGFFVGCGLVGRVSVLAREDTSFVSAKSVNRILLAASDGTRACARRD